MDKIEAGAALGAVADARNAVAMASAAPLWRHAAFGLVMALLMLSIAGGQPFWLLPWALSMMGVAALYWWDRRQTGMFINGYRRGRTLPLTIALLILTVMLAFAALRLNLAGHHALALLTVPAVFVIAFATSLWWERIFLREMEAGR